MQKYAIQRDKKIAKYFLLLILMNILNNVAFILFTNAGMFSTLVATFVIIIAEYTYILSYLVSYVYVDEYRIRKGLVFPRSILYIDINRISCDGKYILLLSENRQFKISILDFHRNRELYSNIIEAVITKAELKTTTAKIMDMVENTYSKEYKATKNKAIAIKGWMKVILFYFISMAVGTLTYIKNFGKYEYGSNIVTKYIFIVCLVMVFITILLIVLSIVSKHRKAPKAIWILQWIHLVFMCLIVHDGGLIYLAFIGESVGAGEYLKLIPKILSYAMYILIISRYLAISRRANATFVMDKPFGKGASKFGS